MNWSLPIPAPVQVASGGRYSDSCSPFWGSFGGRGAFSENTRTVIDIQQLHLRSLPLSVSHEAAPASRAAGRSADLRRRIAAPHRPRLRTALYETVQYSPSAAWKHKAVVRFRGNKKAKLGRDRGSTFRRAVAQAFPRDLRVLLTASNVFKRMSQAELEYVQPIALHGTCIWGMPMRGHRAFRDPAQPTARGLSRPKRRHPSLPGASDLCGPQKMRHLRR